MTGVASFITHQNILLYAYVGIVTLNTATFLSSPFLMSSHLQFLPCMYCLNISGNVLHDIVNGFSCINARINQ
jgi:hypothetical protein